MAIAVVHDDAVVYAKGFGVKQLGASVPVDTHTLFQIGSTSKAFTSTLVDVGYVNNLFLVASAIIERLTGTSWEENVRRRIFTGVMMDAFSDVDNGLFERVAAKS